ncbi:hypothetical protein HDE71_000413 [Janthinobacterium sp. S3M3]|nr:hypothetical protein [Janthinobacterium sp. S3T4]MBB5611427.1 hypothetical protein [Janthinobacterium sp. S3M3]
MGIIFNPIINASYETNEINATTFHKPKQYVRSTLLCQLRDTEDNDKQ